MVFKTSFIAILVWVTFVIPTMAQEHDSIFQKSPEIIKAKDILLDTTAGQSKEVKQMELKPSSSQLKDNALILLSKEEDKYNLGDHQEAAKYDSLWLKELYENNSLFDEMYTEVTSINIDSSFSGSIDTETLKERLATLNEKTPFNIAYNPSLESVIKSFLTRKRDLMERMLTTSQFYFPLFEQELDRYDIPLEIKYLAIVESALNPRARSRVGATGLWQFMYSTGKMYKLDVSSYVDERRDPIASTKAACQYLSALYGIFGDWDLALAAYNSGPGNVNKAIRRSGGYKNYWNIRRNLPRETAGYVPAFLATLYLFEYAEEHGLKGKKVDRPYFETDTVHVKSLITFDQISKLVGIS
ncbi:MAG: lytic transglycosylase domain-containing protein, partial [Bacteroidota bacterium]